MHERVLISLNDQENQEDLKVKVAIKGKLRKNIKAEKKTIEGIDTRHQAHLYSTKQEAALFFALFLHFFLQ